MESHAFFGDFVPNSFIASVEMYGIRKAESASVIFQ